MTEREWREASDLRPSRFGLVAVLAAAVVLRFWALGHGIPYALAVDEPEIMDRAVAMMKTGNFNPRFYDYPGLYIHVQLVTACVRFIAGAVAGTWQSLNAAPTAEFYLWGRAVTAILGVATVWFVFLAGMRWGARHALLAAGIMAVLSPHVRESHYVLTDVPLTFFVALTLVLSLRAHERATSRAFAWAGVAAGLAAATKYTGALALLMPLLACWMTPAAVPSRLMCSLTVVAGAAAAFIVGAPYTFLDLPAFLNGVARLASEYRGGPAESLWLVYLKHLRNAFGWPGILLVGAGAIMGANRLVRGPGRFRWALLLAFALAYYVLVSSQGIGFGRYLLPIFPHLSLLAAAAVISGVSLLRRFAIPRAPRTALIAALTVAAILPPAIQAIGFDRMIGRQGTVELAYSWILENIPEGSVVVVETRGMLLPAQFKATNTPQLRRRDFAGYRDAGVEYLVASSQSYGPYLEAPQNYPREYADYMQIFGQARELVRFSPSDAQPGPELRILKVQP